MGIILLVVMFLTASYLSTRTRSKADGYLLVGLKF